MPGGTGGPHRIQGVGFWAQQKYYNIFSVDSGPFIFRPIQRSLPEAWWVPPANAFQSWTWSPNPNLTPPPIMMQVLRPIWRSLPDQPATPLLQPSVFQAYPLLYGLIPAPFSQDDWPNPQQPWRLDQSW